MVLIIDDSLENLNLILMTDTSLVQTILGFFSKLDGINWGLES